MLILPKSCFLHIPKTGGTWVKAAIRAAGIEAEEFAIDGNTHIGLDRCPAPEKFKFAFVRHPLNLYRSYWQFKMGDGWDPYNPIDMACRTEDFHDFVACVLERFPGVYGKALEEFTGPPEASIDFVGKYERLVEDLIAALSLAGEHFDAQAIRELPPINVSKRDEYPAELTPALEARIREVERAAFERFGYS